MLNFEGETYIVILVNPGHVELTLLNGYVFFHFQPL